MFDDLNCNSPTSPATWGAEPVYGFRGIFKEVPACTPLPVVNRLNWDKSVDRDAEKKNELKLRSISSYVSAVPLFVLNVIAMVTYLI